MADLEREGSDKPTDEIVLHFNHGNVLFIAPLSDTLTRVIVARHATDNDSKVTSQATSDPQLSIATFQRAMDEAGVKLRVLRSEWMTPFHVNERQAKHYRSRIVFLVGDASHIQREWLVPRIHLQEAHK